MPQLKKVVVAVGNDLIYRDTYEQAIAELTGLQPPAAAAAQPGKPAAGETKPKSETSGGADARIEEIRSRMQRYRELASEGKWGEAGKELEAIERLLQRR